MNVRAMVSTWIILNFYWGFKVKLTGSSDESDMRKYSSNFFHSLFLV